MFTTKEFTQWNCVKNINGGLFGGIGFLTIASQLLSLPPPANTCEQIKQLNTIVGIIKKAALNIYMDKFIIYTHILLLIGIGVFNFSKTIFVT